MVGTVWRMEVGMRVMVGTVWRMEVGMRVMVGTLWRMVTQDMEMSREDIHTTAHCRLQHM